MARVLVIAQHDQHSLDPATARCVRCALAISPEVDVAFAGLADAGAVTQAAALQGVSAVLHIADERFEHPVAALLAPPLAAQAAAYTHVLAAGDTFGKDLLPRMAALCNVGQLSEISAVLEPYRFERFVYAGNAVQTLEVDEDKLLMATVRLTAFDPVDTRPAHDTPAAVHRIPAPESLPTHTRFVRLEQSHEESRDLRTAKRIVAGGRGFGDAEGFRLAHRLAEALDAALGASRAAVDSGFASNDMQVGQTGKVVAPELYVAAGISGAIQHLTGIRDAGTVVAINNDPDASIFAAADIGLVGDLFEVLPELIKLIESKQ
ncbi:MAG TPA: FAD-binding protein [Gammaproteobacteria bacterium]|nr:FAD-binding protein [Gammaproteobacteria bacterium]